MNQAEGHRIDRTSSVRKDGGRIMEWYHIQTLLTEIGLYLLWRIYKYLAKKVLQSIERSKEDGTSEHKEKTRYRI